MFNTLPTDDGAYDVIFGIGDINIDVGHIAPLADGRFAAFSIFAGRDEVVTSLEAAEAIIRRAADREMRAINKAIAMIRGEAAGRAAGLIG